MYFIVFAPVLLFLLVFWVVGVFFVVVPGGFIIVFAGAYYAAIGVIGYASLWVRGRRQAARARRRLAGTRSHLAHQADRRSSRQPAISVPTPAAAVSRTSQVGRR
jgi:hypothetical protein